LPRNDVNGPLKEDRYFDFSTAECLVADTKWNTASYNYSEYSINNICRFEFTLLVKITVEDDNGLGLGVPMIQVHLFWRSIVH